MTEQLKRNIVIFKGVFLKDLDDRPIARAQIVQPTISVYDKIPRKFTSPEVWPKGTNLKCWNCDQTFSGYPRFIPINPEYGPGRTEVYEVLGNFCEWNCAITYIAEKIPLNQQCDLARFVCVVSSKFTGRQCEKIQPAPDKVRMQQYCGDHGITPSQFRDEITQLNIDYAYAGSNFN